MYRKKKRRKKEFVCGEKKVENREIREKNGGYRKKQRNLQKRTKNLCEGKKKAKKIEGKQKMRRKN